MKDAFTNGSAHLMQCWKQLRSTLSSGSNDGEQLNSVISFWSHAPLSTSSIDVYAPDAWPDPWQLIHGSCFDDDSIALCIFYTLLLGEDQRWTRDRLCMALVTDDSMRSPRLVLFADQKHMINYEYNTVTDACQPIAGFKILQKYGYDGRSHHLVPGKRIKTKQVINL